MDNQLIWHKVLANPKELAEGRVMTVTAAHKTFCLTHHKGKFSCLDNKCPHQGGPLGEGSIEEGYLRCPWHGWDFDPVTGKPPGGYDDGIDTFPVDIRKDGIYIGLPQEAETVKNISDVVAGTLVNWGLDTVFGMVGHSNLGLADALRRQTKQGKLRYFAVRHEGAAAFAASAYGKLTGRPAACFTIAGPGATNLYTGLWDAKVDRAPLIALTGQVDSQVLGTGNFQELDLVQAFSTVASFNHRVSRDSKHAELANLAMKNALLKRDVVHLTFPDEIQTLPAPDEKIGRPEGRITPLTIAPPKKSLNQATKLIKKAKRPVIITGHGARFHMKGILKLAEILNAPILTTFKGKGQLSDAHPLAGGVLGRSGTPIASWLMNESDLLLVFGASFSKHTGVTDHKITIQVDFDPLALSKFHEIDCAVWGEISVTSQLLYKKLKGKIKTIDQRPLVAERWAIWKKEKKKRLKENRGEGISSIAVFETLNQHAPDDAIMCVDVGNNAYSFGRYYESKANNRFLMSGYLGSIGFALPASMGAWAAVGSERKVIAVAGDGGIGQYLADFSTLVKNDMNITVIVLNNSELGKISKEQRAGEFTVWETKLTNPSFADFARSCGALGFKVEKEEELSAAFDAAITHKGPTLIEVITDVKLI